MINLKTLSSWQCNFHESIHGNSREEKRFFHPFESSWLWMLLLFLLMFNFWLDVSVGVGIGVGVGVQWMNQWDSHGIQVELYFCIEYKYK